MFAGATGFAPLVFLPPVVLPQLFVPWRRAPFWTLLREPKLQWFLEAQVAPAYPFHGKPKLECTKAMLNCRARWCSGAQLPRRGLTPQPRVAQRTLGREATFPLPYPEGAGLPGSG